MRARTELDSNRNIGQFLEHRTNGDTRVVRGTARDKQQSSSPSDDREVRLQSTERDRVGVKVDSTSHGVDDRLGLLVNLLLHKVVELALHDLGELDLESLNRSNRRNGVVSPQSVDVEFWRKS